MFQHLFLIN